MNLTVLAASGRTGLAITRQALERGHTVTAIARDPGRITLPASAGLHKVAGDVNDPASIAADDIVLAAGARFSMPRFPGTVALPLAG